MAMFIAQHQYAYPAAPPPLRQYAGQNTSSAFSSSANADEDWTKISDLAERRRIQNRIAQRNYRKKLKKRLEDLERRAGSSDDIDSEKQSQGSPASQSSTTTVDPSSSSSSQKGSKASSNPSRKTQPPAAPSKASPHNQYTTPLDGADDFIFTSPYDDRARSHTPPPMFTYSAYSSTDDMLMDPYGAVASHYPAMTTTDDYPSYMAPASLPVPVTLPSVTLFSDAVVKRDAFAAIDDGLGAYMSYGFAPPGLDAGMPSPYDSNIQTPPLCHSFDHSANCSESGYEYPTTPLSMPGSPAMM